MVRTGFIGVGSQGGPMAGSMLAAGYPLTVLALKPEELEPFAAKGAVAATSAAALGAACDHVGVCVVDDAGVMQVCDTLIPAMREGSRLVIHSTVLPETCERLAERCAARGIVFVDAPVSGGGAAVADRTLVVMCGGTAEAVETVRPVLESFAGTIVHLGPAGAGQRAKIINNALMAANMGLAHAALGLAEGLSLDRAALAELIKLSSGRSFAFDVYARLPTPAAFAHGGPLLRKDVNLLRSITPADSPSATLADAAADFLTAATGGAG